MVRSNTPTSLVTPAPSPTASTSTPEPTPYPRETLSSPVVTFPPLSPTPPASASCVGSGHRGSGPPTMLFIQGSAPGVCEPRVTHFDLGYLGAGIPQISRCAPISLNTYILSFQFLRRHYLRYNFSFTVCEMWVSNEKKNEDPPKDCQDAYKAACKGTVYEFLKDGCKD